MSDRAISNFGGKDVPDAGFDRARIVFLPLCYENAVSYGTGAGDGPYHILEASEQLERIDEETGFDWGTLRIHTLAPPYLSKDPETAVGQMRRSAARVLEAGKFLLSLGGDHAVSIGPIRAAARLFPDLGVLQVDAHSDLRQEWNGSRYNHACVMRRVIDDEGLVSVQVGIRSFSKEEFEIMRERDLAVFFAHDIDPLDSTWIERAVERLPAHVYLTVDLDGLDPAAMPGTGTPEPGGLSYRQVVGLVRALGKRRHVVGADITELAKIPGTQVSEFTAAKIATKIMVFCTPRPPAHPTVT
jgi:agmatinase